MDNNKYADLSKTGTNLTDVDAVLDAISNIIHTRVGEVPHKREFGSNIENYLFHPYSFIVSKLILSDLKYSITRWEPRAEVLGLSTVSLDPDHRVYGLYLLIKVKGFENPVEYKESLISKEALSR